MVRGSKWAIWTLYFVVFVDLFQVAFVFPFIPTIVKSFGGTQERVAHDVALLASLAAIGEAIGSPVIGSLSDRFGRRPVMIASTFGNACSCLVLGFARSLPVAVLARLINGLTGSTVGIANTCLVDMTTDDERPGYMSTMTSYIGIGLALGPIAGGYLYQLGGVEIACLAAAVISMLNGFCIILFVPESNETSSQQSPQQSSETLTWKAWLMSFFPTFPVKLWILFLASFFASPISVVFDTYANIYTADRFYAGDMGKATMLFSHCMSAIGACLLIIPLFIYKPFLKLVGFNGSIVVGFSTVIIGLIGNGFAADPLTFLAMTAVWAVGFQIMGPVVPMLISRLAPSSAIGAAFGMLTSFGNASRVIGPTMLAPLYNMKHESVFFFLGASLTVVFFIVFGIALSTSHGPSPQNAGEEELAEPTLTRQNSLQGTRGYEVYGAMPEQLHEVKNAFGGLLQLRRATTDIEDARTVPLSLHRSKSEGSIQVPV